MAPRRKLPSVFKIVPGVRFTNKLKIPREYLQHFHGNVPHQCRLQTTGRTWLVDVEEVNKKFYFQKGWNEFVQDNGLKYGELLVFHYAGNSNFHVDIFGKNTCRELFVMPEIEEANEEDDDVSLEISDDSPVSSPPPQKKYKTSSSGKGQMKNKEAHWSKSEMKKEDRGGTSSTQRFIRQKHEHQWRAHVRAEAFKYENPSAFLVSMKPTYIKYKFVVSPVHGEEWRPKNKTSLICLSDSTSVVSPLKSMKKVDANPATKSNIEKIGNFKVKGDREEADKEVLRFVYDVLAENKETIVDSGNFFTSREIVWSLKPNGLVEDDVINLFSDYLFQGRFPSNSCCYFTTYFCQKMENYRCRDMCGDSVRTVSKSLGVKRFDNDIPKCEKIFIPMHDINHWYLLVVRLDNQTGEVWDSLACNRRRISKCKAIMKTLDIIYYNVKFTVKNVVKKKFADFDIFEPAQCPKQEGGSDCGVYVIKHMQCYGSEWWHQFNSEEVRMDLTIELVRNKFNRCWKWIDAAIKAPPPPTFATQKTVRQSKAASKKVTVKNPTVQLRTRAQSKRGVASNVRRSRFAKFQQLLVHKKSKTSSGGRADITPNFRKRAPHLDKSGMKRKVPHWFKSKMINNSDTDSADEDDQDDDENEDEEEEEETQDEEIEEEDDGDSVETLNGSLPCSRTVGKYTLASRLHQRKRKSSSAKAETNIKTDREEEILKAIALWRAKAFKFNSVNPCNCFVVSLSATYARGYFLNLPRSFAAIHLTNPRPGHVTLWVEKSSWSVKVSYFGTITRLVAGWSEFVHVNNLKIGDACVFVLTNAIKSEYDVEIFRVTDAVCT